MIAIIGLWYGMIVQGAMDLYGVEVKTHSFGAFDIIKYIVFLIIFAVLTVTFVDMLRE